MASREGKRKRTLSSRLVSRVSQQSSASARRSEHQRRRLESLENDNALADERAAVLGEEDEEFTVTTPEEIAAMGPCFKGVRRGGASKPGKRQTRAAREEIKTKKAAGTRSFAAMLEESGLEEKIRRKGRNQATSENPAVHKVEEERSEHDALEVKYNYITAAAGPSKWTAARKFCSVCGFPSTYTCVQCAARICSRKCNVTHTETRCLKFVVS